MSFYSKQVTAWFIKHGSVALPEQFWRIPHDEESYEMKCEVYFKDFGGSQFAGATMLDHQLSFETSAVLPAKDVKEIPDEIFIAVPFIGADDILLTGPTLVLNYMLSDADLVSLDDPRNPGKQVDAMIAKPGSCFMNEDKTALYILDFKFPGCVAPYPCVKVAVYNEGCPFMKVARVFSSDLSMNKRVIGYLCKEPEHCHIALECDAKSLTDEQLIDMTIECIYRENIEDRDTYSTVVVRC